MPLRADPSQGFRGARREGDLPWLLMLSGFHCNISGITKEKVGLFAKTSQSQANPDSFITEPLLGSSYSSVLTISTIAEPFLSSC